MASHWPEVGVVSALAALTLNSSGDGCSRAATTWLGLGLGLGLGLVLVLGLGLGLG